MQGVTARAMRLRSQYHFGQVCVEPLQERHLRRPSAVAGSNWVNEIKPGAASRKELKVSKNPLRQGALKVQNPECKITFRARELYKTT